MALDKQLFYSAIEQIAEEKGIPKEKIKETIEAAIAAAYKKDFGKKTQNIRAVFDLGTAEVKVYQVKLAVDETMLKKEEDSQEDKEKQELTEERKIKFNPERHIMLAEARHIKKDIKPGQDLLFEMSPADEFGRIASQTAKQVIIQKLREVEKETIFSDYKNKEGEIISGIIHRQEGPILFLDLGKVSALLFPEEQIPGEFLKIGQRVKAIILEVKDEPRGPLILISRAHPNFVAELFKLEVPEISSGSVIIKFLAREPGSRTKIAVSAVQENLDPIGSCVGQKGARVLSVINELDGEKIDIVEFSDDSAKFIENALSPAKILDTEIDENFHSAKVIVAPDQLSLAIGKKGQNVRLAAKLTNFKIDIIVQEKKETIKEAINQNSN